MQERTNSKDPVAAKSTLVAVNFYGNLRWGALLRKEVASGELSGIELHLVRGRREDAFCPESRTAFERGICDRIKTHANIGLVVIATCEPYLNRAPSYEWMDRCYYGTSLDMIHKVKGGIRNTRPDATSPSYDRIDTLFSTYRPCADGQFELNGLPVLTLGSIHSSENVKAAAISAASLIKITHRLHQERIVD